MGVRELWKVGGFLSFSRRLELKRKQTDFIMCYG